VVYFVYYGEFIDLKETWDSIFNLTYDNFYGCGYYDTLDISVTYCLYNFECTFMFFFTNIVAHAFKLMTVASTTADIMMNFSYETPQLLQEYMY
jgi:hypothetical protein